MQFAINLEQTRVRGKGLMLYEALQEYHVFAVPSREGLKKLVLP